MNQIRRIGLFGERKKRVGGLSMANATVSKVGLIAEPLTSGRTHGDSNATDCVLAFAVRYAAMAGPEPQESLFGVELSGTGFEFSALR